MPLCTVIREKRRALGMTQEQVAEFLGVSAPAVNKWEKGSTCPDIALLPALARFLKTDVNTLLCFQESLSEKEIGLFLNELSACFHDKGFEAAFALAMDKVEEYPFCAQLLYLVALALQGSLMMASLSSEQIQGYTSQITALYERVAQCNDPKYSNEASYMLASRYILTQQYDKAQAILDALPDYNALDKRSLQAQLWMKCKKLSEAAQLLEHKLLASLAEAQTTLTVLAKISVLEGDVQSALRLAACAQNEARTFGLWEYGAFLVPLETAVANKDIASTLAILHPMLAALLIPWDIENCPVAKHLPQKPHEENLGSQMLSALLTELETSEDYAFLRSSAEFEALIAQYRAKCR